MLMCCVFLFKCTTGNRENPFDPVNISSVGTGDTTNNNDTSQFIAPPRITGHPKDEIVLEGNTAMFSVVAAGSDLSYQWKRNGVNFGSNSKSCSYTATMSRNGDYVWCVVSNSAGSDTSNTAELTVEEDEFKGLYDYRILTASTTIGATVWLLDLNGDEGTATGGVCIGDICAEDEYDIELHVTSSSTWYQTVGASIDYKFMMKQDSNGDWYFDEMCVEGSGCFAVDDY